MLQSAANIAKRLVPDIAKLLATSYGGPMAGAVAHRLTEEALQRVADAVTRYLTAQTPAAAMAPEVKQAQVEQFEASLAAHPTEAEPLRREIAQIAEELRESYVFAFSRSEMEREISQRSATSETTVQTERDRAYAQNRMLSQESRILAYAPAALSLIILGGFFYCAFSLIARPGGNTENKELLYLVLGALTTSVSAVVTYWFGSSAEATRRSVTQQYEQAATQRTESERSASVRQLR